MNKSRTRVKKLTITAIMSAMASVLMFISLPIPIFPQFLEIDVSDLPAIICAFAIGPIWGIAVELIKNFIHMTVSHTGTIGEAANFIIGASFVFPAGIIYSRKHNKQGALLGLAVGVISMTLVGAIANYYVLIPLYSKFMPIDSIIALGTKVNHLITDKTSLILFGIVPFNLFKGAVVSAVTLLIYKPLSHILHR